MQIELCLAWSLQKNSLTRKIFKSTSAHALVEDYAGRISKFTAVQVLGDSLPKMKRSPEAVVWCCDLPPKGKMLSSEALAEKLQLLLSSGISKWQIVLGPHNGFSQADYDRLRPEMIWSFGPMTLPHELAAVVAIEQIYRAWTILKNHPYHGGHFKK